MTVFPKARDMASAIEAISNILFDADVLDPVSLSNITYALATLRAKKTEQSWRYSISDDTPIRFTSLRDRDNFEYRPEISVEDIEVNHGAEGLPFTRWNVVLTLKYVDPARRSPRWHFDICNPGQPGPVMHLQFGGRENVVRADDEALKLPRWNTMLMDAVLLIEAVTANFFHDIWVAKIRDNPTFRTHVKSSEQLCYPYALEQMRQVVAASSERTMLHAIWNVA
jgi:hypothetical protein